MLVHRAHHAGVDVAHAHFLEVRDDEEVFFKAVPDGDDDGGLVVQLQFPQGGRIGIIRYHGVSHQVLDLLQFFIRGGDGHYFNVAGGKLRAELLSKLAQADNGISHDGMFRLTEF